MDSGEMCAGTRPDETLRPPEISSIDLGLAVEPGRICASNVRLP